MKELVMRFCQWIVLLFSILLMLGTGLCSLVSVPIFVQSADSGFGLIWLIGLGICYASWLTSNSLWRDMHQRKDEKDEP